MHYQYSDVMRVCEIRLSELRCQYQTMSQKVLKEEPPRKRLLFSTSHAGHQAETRSVLYLCERLPGLADLKSEISDLKTMAEKISRQLRAWCESLQNSDIRGQRYLTNKSRNKTRETREREEFLKELGDIRSRKP